MINLDEWLIDLLITLLRSLNNKEQQEYILGQSSMLVHPGLVVLVLLLELRQTLLQFNVGLHLWQQKNETKTKQFGTKLHLFH